MTHAVVRVMPGVSRAIRRHDWPEALELLVAAGVTPAAAEAFVAFSAEGEHERAAEKPHCTWNDHHRRGTNDVPDDRIHRPRGPAGEAGAHQLA